MLLELLLPQQLRLSLLLPRLLGPSELFVLPLLLLLLLLLLPLPFPFP
jgi:hypothetical protein